MRKQPDTLDDELVLYYYGEAPRPKKIRRRLDADAAYRARYEELCRVLRAIDSSPVPDPEPDYGTRVWQRLKPRLGEPPRPSLRGRLGAWMTPPSSPVRGLALAGAFAAALVVAFLAGRVSVNGEAEGLDLTEIGRQRILAVEVHEHLERSERLLTELANLPADGPVDLAFERASAEALVGSNRLYRQVSERAGRSDLAALLDELERVLLELAHSPDELAAPELEYIRTRIGDTLFKVRLVGSHLRHEKTRSPNGDNV